MKISLPTDIPQNTPEWEDIRKKLITSTDVAGVLKIGKFSTGEKSTKEKITFDKKNIDPMSWGRILEPVARRHLEETTKTPIDILGLRHNNIIGASPDGVQYIDNEPMLVEIKCPKVRQITYLVPIEYWVQMQIAMEVFGVDRCLYAEYKFDITEKPFIRDLSLIYGNVNCPDTGKDTGLYWIYHTHWTVVISRDKNWFNSVYPDIKRYHSMMLSGKRLRSENSEGIYIGKLGNFFRNDKILDYLEKFYPETREHDIFLDYYNQINSEYKLSIFKKIGKAEMPDGLRRTLEIEKTMYSFNSEYIEYTDQDILFFGKVYTEDRKTYEKFDVIMKRKEFLKIYTEVAGYSHETVYIKIKCCDLKTKKDGTVSGRETYRAVVPFLILDKNGNFGVVNPVSDISDKIEKGLEWLSSITKDLIIYPNMKNKLDTEYRSAKKKIAENLEELTLLSYLTIEMRETLHKKGIFKISDLTPEKFTEVFSIENKNHKKICNFLGSELHLPKFPDTGLEFFVDFETTGINSRRIYLMGILVVKENKESEFRSFVVENIGVEEEKKCVWSGLEYMKKMGKGKVFHWSQAEPSILANTGLELPEGYEFVDLYSFFVENNAVVPGIKGYSLKEVGNRLFALGKINSKWMFGNGSMALSIGLQIEQKCKITKEKFCDDARVEKLCQYNYYDCRVMSEIRGLLM